jgi:predicted DNA-binding protein (UPF0251 family)
VCFWGSSSRLYKFFTTSFIISKQFFANLLIIEGEAAVDNGASLLVIEYGGLSMNKYRKLVGIFAVVVLVLIVGVTAVALAQDEEPVEPEPDVTAPILPGEGIAPPQDRQWRDRAPERLFTPDEMDAALAEELGISVDELNEARDVAKASLLQQAVDEGKITQAQVDAILNGEGRLDFMRTLRDEYFPQGSIQAATAEALGMTVEEFEAAQAEGKRLPEIAEEQGVDVTAVTEAVRAAFEEAVAQAVAEGVITQTQADRLLSHEGTLRDFGRGRGGPRGHRPPGGERPGFFERPFSDQNSE